MSDHSSNTPARAQDAPTPAASLDLDQVVDDTLVLTTVDGAEDFLQADLAKLADIQNVTRSRAMISCRLTGTLRTLHAVRLYGGVAVPLSTPNGLEPDLQPLAGSLHRGLLAAFSGSALRFRVGVPDSALRQQVIGRVASAFGWVNDPGDWDINITGGHHGWIAQIGALHYSRRFGSLDRRPWATTPLVAETLVRLAKLTPGMSVHDPCCGTATLLVVAHQNVSALRLSGTDHDSATSAIGRSNLRRFGIDAELTTVNATPIAAGTGTVDRVIANLPFGKQVGSHDHNLRLYPALLNETARVLAHGGRAVLLTEDKQLLREAVRRTKGLKLIKERILRYHGATPTCYVLGPTRRRLAASPKRG